MKSSLTAALLTAVPLSLAQHHYGPPHEGPHSGGPWPGSWPAGARPTSWGGHEWPSAPSSSASASASASVSASATSPTASSSATSTPQSCTPLTTDEIEALGNNTLFTRWRPRSHVIAPAGWMNDPCGPMYDPVQDLYHIFYQWHPQHINWGNISWGYATSKDLITWEDHVCHSTSDQLGVRADISFRMAGRTLKLLLSDPAAMAGHHPPTH